MEFAYLSYFITHQSYRNKGIGKKVYKAAMASVGDRSVTLDAVTSDMVTLYRKWGFHESNTVLDTYHGVINVQSLTNIISNMDQKIKVIDRTDDIAGDVLEYDFKIGRRYRENYIQTISASSNCFCKCAVSDGKIVGFGVLQPFNSAWWKVSMLYADNKEIAALIIRHFLLSIPNENPPMIIGIINKYEGPRKLCQSIGMEFHKREFRMVSKRDMEIDYNRIWFYNNLLHEPY